MGNKSPTEVIKKPKVSKVNPKKQHTQKNLYKS